MNGRINALVLAAALACFAGCVTDQNADPIPGEPELTHTAVGEAYTVKPEAGKAWWIRGYVVAVTPGKIDSTYLRSQIRIIAYDTVTGVLILRVQDTLSGSADSVSDKTFRTTSMAASGFGADGAIRGLNPFNRAVDRPVSVKATFTIQGVAYADLHQFTPSTCLKQSIDKYGCGGGEYAYVPGWGQVSESGTYSSYFLGQQESRHAYEVWAIAAP